MATKREHTPKAVLRLPDLEQPKSASEPRLAFNRIVVTRYRISLEQAHYAASTINLILAAVDLTADPKTTVGYESE